MNVDADVSGRSSGSMSSKAPPAKAPLPPLTSPALPMGSSRPPPTYSPTSMKRGSGSRLITPAKPGPHSSLAVPGRPAALNTTLGAKLNSTNVAERKLSASLLSIKLFWGPELEKERKLRVSEKARAEKAEVLLREQLQKGVSYMKKLTFLQGAYEELEQSAGKKSKMETDLRHSLEEQLRTLRADTAASDGFSAVELKQKVRRRDKSIAELKEAVARLEGDKAGLEQQIRDNPAEHAARLRADAEEIVKTNQAQMDRMGAELNELRRQGDTLLVQKQKLAVLTADLNTRTSQYESSKATVDKLVEDLAATEENYVEELRAKEDELRATVAAKQAEVEAALGRSSQLQADGRGLREQLDETARLLVERTEQLDAEARSKAALAQRLEADVSALQQAKSGLQADLSALQLEAEASREEARAQINELNTQLEDKAASIQLLTAKLDAIPQLQAEVDGLKQTLGTQHAELSDALAAQDQLLRSEELCKALQDDILQRETQIEQANDKLTATIEGFEERISAMSATIAKRDAELEQLRHDLDAAHAFEAKCGTLTTTLQAREAEVAELSAKLARIKELEAEVERITGLLATKEATISELRREHHGQASKLDEENEELRVSLAVRSSELESALAQAGKLADSEHLCGVLGETIGEKEEQISALQDQLGELTVLRSTIEQQHERIAEANRDKEQLQSSLNETEATLQHELAEARTLLATREGELGHLAVEKQTETNRLESLAESLEKKLQAAKSQAKEESTTLTSKITKAYKAMEALRIKLSESDKGLQQTKRQHRDEIEVVRHKERLAAQSAQHHKDEMSQAQQQLTDLRKEYEAKLVDFDALQQQGKERERNLLRKLRESKGQTQAAEAGLEAEQAKLRSSQHEEDKLRHELEALANTLGAMEAERDTLLEEGQLQAEAMGQMTDRLSEKSQQLARFEEAIGDLEQQISRKESMICQLEAEHRDLQEKMIFERTNTLLGMVSEKDQRIAVLEMAGAKKHKADIDELNAAREKDIRALKEQFDKRAALLAAANTSKDSLDRSREASSREELLERLQVRETDGSRLRTYIDQLLGEVLRQPETVSMAIMTGLPRLQQDAMADEAKVARMGDKDIKALLKRRDKDNANLEAYVDQLLARIVEHRPSMLEVMSFSGR